MARRSNIHTVFHAMEEKGVFERNPANAEARDQVTGESIYKGPVPYPKMLYHPKGAERVLVPAEIVLTPMGPQRVGEQRQLMYRLVNSELEEHEALADGWHVKARDSILARMKIEGRDTSVAPPLAPQQQIDDLNRQIAALQAEKADREAKEMAANRAGGSVVMPRPAAKTAKVAASSLTEEPAALTIARAARAAGPEGGY